MIYNIEDKVNEMSLLSSDINEHILTMVKYGKECEFIIEMGVRGILSTWGWLGSYPKKIKCYDMHHPSKWGGDLESVYDTAAFYNIEFNFQIADVLKIEIEECDLLFIDTWHTYDQLSLELELHNKKVRKYLCFHDTTSYEFNNESIGSENTMGEYKSFDKQGLWPAIEDFLNLHPEWILHERYYNNNGFTILKKIDFIC